MNDRSFNTQNEALEKSQHCVSRPQFHSLNNEKSIEKCSSSVCWRCIFIYIFDPNIICLLVYFLSRVITKLILLNFLGYSFKKETFVLTAGVEWICKHVISGCFDSRVNRDQWKWCINNFWVIAWSQSNLFLSRYEWSSWSMGLMPQTKQIAPWNLRVFVRMGQRLFDMWMLQIFHSLAW